MKKTQISGTTNSLRTEQQLGNCYGDDNPDAWFPELSKGAPSPAKMRALGLETSRAIILCNACPKKVECLEEGMKPKNLPYGIWGGRLAGERLLLADARGLDYMVKGRTSGDYVHTGDITKRVGKGRYKGSVVIKEVEGVTVEEKRGALRLLRILWPWIKG
jgi:hypothetical protein